MADLIFDRLMNIASAFSVVRAPGGGSHTALLSLANPLDGRLTIAETLVETVLEAASVDLSWIDKGVRFADTPITDPQTVGGQPLSDAVPGATQTLLNLLAPVNFRARSTRPACRDCSRRSPRRSPFRSRRT